MKTLRFAILSLLLAALGGCASGPYYYGGTSNLSACHRHRLEGTGSDE